jgi:acyl carrier protein
MMMTHAQRRSESFSTAPWAAGDVEAEILAFLQQLPTAAALAPLSRSTQLLEQGLLDSLGVLELTQMLTDRFTIEISDEDFTTSNFATLGDLVALVERKLTTP